MKIKLEGKEKNRYYGKFSKGQKRWKLGKLKIWNRNKSYNELERNNLGFRRGFGIQ